MSSVAEAQSSGVARVHINYMQLSFEAQLLHEKEIADLRVAIEKEKAAYEKEKAEAAHEREEADLLLALSDLLLALEKEKADHQVTLEKVEELQKEICCLKSVGALPPLLKVEDTPEATEGGRRHPRAP